MRTENEMMESILFFAQQDERVRVVGMEGSRTNANVPKDKFQDYDISYVVTEIESFKRTDAWLDYLGSRAMMQKPESMSLFSPELGNWFSYLMLFEDGNRVDLTLVPLEELNIYLASDPLLRILMDKDSRVTASPVPTDKPFHVQKPSPKYFDDCCNEFWFCASCVAKGICRKEFLFAAEHLNGIVRKELIRMLSWKVGIETGFSLSVGKMEKFLGAYVDEQVWNRLLATFRNESLHALQDALIMCMELFHEISYFVAQKLRYAYPHYSQNVTKYIQNMLRDAGV